MPLPPLDDDAYRRIPAGLRSNLYGAAGRIDLRAAGSPRSSPAPTASSSTPPSARPGAP